MSHTARSLVNSLSARQVPTTARIDRVDHLANSVRVVASFNREPDRETAKALIENAFKGTLEVVDNSFRIRKRGQRIQVAGFLREKAQVKPMSETANLKEVASNVYMDPADNSIWTPKNGQIVRNQSESLAELASVATVTKSLHRTPDAATVSVKPYAGFENTMVVAYVDPENPDEVKYGLRIDEDNVWSENDGIQELSEDLVIDTESLAGADFEPTLAETANVNDAQSMIDYYSKVYNYDPAYLDGVKKVIQTRALV